MATTVEARQVTKSVSKAKVKGQVVEVNGEPVREALVHYGGVDVFFADGSQVRFAADDKLSVVVKDADSEPYDREMGSPWGAKAVDQRVLADNEESLKEAKKATNSAKKASKKSD